MSTAYVLVTVAAAAATLVASGIDVFRAQWVRANMRGYGLPEWTLYPLAAIKLAGALGLLAGLVYRPLGLASGICLVLYFLGALATVLRARAYTDLGYPLPYLLLAAGSVALCVLT
ncbi:DoxX family protein [Nocardia brasiliensis]|uniref:DoxX family protein n=1 Tax=Nocardia brasiliensis TaxID=37326 RepID=A0A6G9XSY3_NOCBR|nr:DoxX family protein [Nocardia brasiliensis]QIS04007.1 DoxX family protein [Nocardia brasiliensis]